MDFFLKTSEIVPGRSTSFEILKPAHLAPTFLTFFFLAQTKKGELLIQTTAGKNLILICKSPTLDRTQGSAQVIN